MRQTLSDVLTRPALWKIIIPSGVLNEMESYLKEQIDSEASNLIAKTWDQTAIPELTTDGEDVVFPQSPQVLKKVQTANNQTKRIQIKAEKEKKHIKIKDVGDLRKYLKVRKRTRTQFIQDVKKRNIWMKKRYKFLRRGKDSYNCYLQIGKDLTKMTFGKWETNKPLSPEWVKEIIYSK